MNVITGEKIQDLCDVYIGLVEDLYFNPFISKQTHKHLHINCINQPYNNPRFVFCYSHRLHILKDKIKYFLNDFVLISGNSDEDIKLGNTSVPILNHPKLIMWYAQNLHFSHPKARVLPIGLANSQWDHGKIDYNKLKKDLIFISKRKDAYFSFNVSTNEKQRNICLNDVSKKNIKFLDFIEPYNNLIRLASYQFCICPIGNGVDTHRLWEALYLETIPIVVKNPNVELIQKQFNVPMIILNSWNDLDLNKIDYYNWKWDGVYDRISFDAIAKEIKSL